MAQLSEQARLQQSETFVAVGNKAFNAETQQVFEALEQMLEFNPSYDIVEKDNSRNTVVFRCFSGNTMIRAHVEPGMDHASVVGIDMVQGDTIAHDISNRIFTELREQIIVLDQSAYSRQVTQKRIVDMMMHENGGPRSKFVFVALFSAAMLIVGACAVFSDPVGWGDIMSMIVMAFGTSLVAWYITRPSGKVSGRKLASLAVAICIVGTLLLVIANIIGSISNSL